MVNSKTILNALPKALETINLPTLGKKLQGKVRDFYILKHKRVTITTDRQSAFDVILGNIPYKGAVLNQLAAFWFDATKDIVSNHMISVPDPNVLVSKNCKPIPVEMVVRGYLSGVTKTSIWYSYEKGEREIYGMHFPDGMKKNQKLPAPVITPTTHPEAGSNLHDERLTRDEIIERKIVDKKLYEQMEKVALELFAFGQKWCEKHGLILVDTKYEFGLIDDKLTLIDEIHTPDSSRFWIAETYNKRLERGEEPDNFDKEYLRLWYAKRGYMGDGKPPKMTEELAIELSQRYIKTYEMLTEKTFESFPYPIEERIKRTSKSWYTLTMTLLTNWIFLSILAGLASNGFNFLSRYLLKDQEDSTAFAWFFEIFRFLFFTLAAITIDWKFVLTTNSIILFLLLGFTEWISVYWYMKMHEKSHLSISAILSRTRLIWVPIIAYFLIEEKLKLSEYAGILILFFGMIIVVSPKKLFVDKGATYAGLSAFMLALNTVFTKMAFPYGSNSIINASIAFIPAIFFPTLMKNAKPRLKKIMQANLPLKFLAVAINIISVYLFTLALRFGDPGKVNAVYQGMFIFSVLAGIIFLHERQNIGKKLIGAIITILGVIILSVS